MDQFLDTHRVFRWEPAPKEKWIEWSEGSEIPEGTNLVYVKVEDLGKFLKVLKEKDG